MTRTIFKIIEKGGEENRKIIFFLSTVFILFKRYTYFLVNFFFSITNTKLSSRILTGKKKNVHTDTHSRQNI